MFKPPPVSRCLNISLIATVLAVLIIGFINTRAEAEGDRGVLIFKCEDLKPGVRLTVTSHNLLEATAVLRTTKASNVIMTKQLPYKFFVDKPLSKYELVRCVPKDLGDWKFDYEYAYAIGVPSQAKTVDYVYSLPYAKDKHFRVSQSYLGSFSHYKGSQNEYAIDFVMPPGTRILASRPGVVISCKGESKVGGPTKKFIDKQNFVIIKHGDGTYASYDHLKHNGVLVRVGQKVGAGTPIGLCGSTGMSESPHLHLCVFRVKDEYTLVSVPFRVRTAKGIVPQLKEDHIY